MIFVNKMIVCFESDKKKFNFHFFFSFAYNYFLAMFLNDRSLKCPVVAQGRRKLGATASPTCSGRPFLARFPLLSFAILPILCFPFHYSPFLSLPLRSLSFFAFLDFILCVFLFHNFIWIIAFLLKVFF